MSLPRRRLLASLAAAGGLSGCLGVDLRPPPGGGGDDTTYPERTTATGQLPLARHGSPPTICEESINERSGIDAVVDPAFDADWSGYEVGRQYGLDDDDVVIGLDRGGRARAYPISILYYHEVVNDVLDVPLLVTYCPLCNSGMVADRRVGGRSRSFHVSGLLWRPPGLETAIRERRGDVFGVDGDEADRRLVNRGNLVMYDAETRSYWSQMLATAICGEHRGSTLEIVPSTTATWDDWRDAHPDTEVLLPPPYSATDADAP